MEFMQTDFVKDPFIYNSGKASVFYNKYFNLFSIFYFLLITTKSEITTLWTKIKQSQDRALVTHCSNIACPMSIVH